MKLIVEYVIKGKFFEIVPDDFEIEDYDDDRLIDTIGITPATVEVESMSVQKELETK